MTEGQICVIKYRDLINCVNDQCNIEIDILIIFRTDSSTEKIRIENNNGKNNRSSTGSRPKLEDDTEKQLEMQLLESPLTETDIRQPKKEVTITLLFFSL